MASSKSCLVAALCILVISTTLTGYTEAASCCVRYSRRKVPCEKILAYDIQTITGSCDINAIIFHLPGRFVCANPSDKRTKKCMKIVERRKNTQDVKRKISHVKSGLNLDLES